jgi:FkbM family methyltransferase
MDRRSFLTGALAGAPLAGAAGFAARVAYERAYAKAQPPGRLSFSQQGEDIVLYHILHDLLKVETPTYIDIGAADPVDANNTFLLYWTGGHGVLVEPNPMYVERLKQRRPKDIVVAAGVGVGDATEADYYMIRGKPTLNTFSPEEAARLRAGAKEDPVEAVVKMPLVTVNRLIASHLGKAPDLLSIDVEGLDLDILHTLDFATYRPGAIIAETIKMGTVDVNAELVDFVVSRGYAVRGGSMINTVFVDRNRYARVSN